MGFWGLLISTTVHGAEPPFNPMSITLGFHEYGPVSAKVRLNAQRRVAAIYEAVGVAITWARTSTALDRHQSIKSEGLEDFSILLERGQRLAELHPCRSDALGCVPRDNVNRGRIAYVSLDQIVTVAIDVDWDLEELLALVIAHEVGHLLLPSGTHSPDGIMRAHWDVETLRRTNPRGLAFTRDQAVRIRTTVAACALGRLSRDDKRPMHVGPANQ